ncbi:MAG: hypothetical protein ACLQVD_21480 [Capsulimonadaceae bacterium]
MDESLNCAVRTGAERLDSGETVTDAASIRPGGMAAITEQDVTLSIDRVFDINAMVRRHAGTTLPSSGEMRCPECETGILCYLVDRGQGISVECSTRGCLSWDWRH